MAKILVVEDERVLADSIAEGLREESHSVDLAHDGETGLWAAGGKIFDLLILDIMLPALSGLEICRQLRERGITTPILFLTARAATQDIVEGLDAGGTDYLRKPFSFHELLARVRALVRTQGTKASAIISVEDLEVDTTLRRVRRGGKLLELTAKEYQILEALIRNVGGIVSRDALTAALWEGDLEPDSNSLAVHVSTLRKRVDGDHARKLIHTKRGLGYILE